MQIMNCVRIGGELLVYGWSSAETELVDYNVKKTSEIDLFSAADLAGQQVTSYFLLIYLDIIYK